MRRRTEVTPTETAEVAAVRSEGAKAVAETSAKLAAELDKSAPKRIQFDSANKAVGSPLNPDFERIIETIFVDKPFEEYQRLEKILRVGEGRSDHGSVNRALDEAESNARLAFRLSITAKCERDRWERDNDVVFAVMRREASDALQREKDQGVRSKQITDADVVAMCSQMFPEEWRHQEHKRRQVELMVKDMEDLAAKWDSRCRSLNAMLSKQR